jgi:hypothetical protein
LREAGALSVLFSNLSYYDTGTASASAQALSNLANNGITAYNSHIIEINQIELNKMGVIDVLNRLVNHEDLDVKRQSVRVYCSLYPNSKIKAKIRSSPECLPLIVKLLQEDDELSVINACECISVLGSDRNLFLH